ncbi:hypothetical protein J2Z75_005903, partial [Rhizobium herbae]|nr:hypothetical protein [Rhizobium herbae]
MKPINQCHMRVRTDRDTAVKYYCEKSLFNVGLNSSNEIT